MLVEDSVIDEFEGILRKKYDLVLEEQKVEFEADQRNGDLIMKELSPRWAEGVVVPRVKRKAQGVIEGNNSKALSGPDAKRYRSATMRAAHLAQDRPDLGEDAKCRARSMQDPREDHWQELKQLVRYTKQRPRCV